ncbi:MAG: Hsp20/alpha crystallin family protein [Methanotrichaceae archaeon]|nr:Hsp20/alpha crystallin family protein [Methanotrichaceae archaeon]
MEKEPKDKDETKDDYEERIKRLEKKIADLEKESKKQKEEIHVEGIVESMVGQFIPGLGGIIRALEQSSPEFRQRIADTDAEIRHRIDVGWSSKPVVDYHISTRPVKRGPMQTTPRPPSVRMPEKGPTREPIVDVLEGKEETTVIAELPGVSEEDLKVDLTGNTLEITAGQFSKKVSLSRPAKAILEQSYKNGILQVKLSLE